MFQSRSTDLRHQSTRRKLRTLAKMFRAEGRVTAVKLGAVDYLAKPADADDIYNALVAAATDRKAVPPENPMPADRGRWAHIQRDYELCET
jgi:ActR/RegA family two-component response regulator